MSFKFGFWLPAVLAWLGAGQLFGQIIYSNSPMFGSPGDLVRIYGDGFYPGALIVLYSGTKDPTAQATSATLIQSQVPAGAISGYISVQIDRNSPVYSPQPFTIIGPGPYVADFNPSSGTDNTKVYIDGAHFTGVTNVTFNGVSGQSLFVESDIRIQVNAPVGVSSGPIVVSAPLGVCASTNFYVPPVITGFAPVSGRVGTNVVITGRNFTNAWQVTFGGVAAPTFTVNSNTQIVARVPTNAITGSITVFAPAGLYPSSSNFVVQPTIFGFSPGFGPAGTVVTVTGANFNVGTPAVKFNNVNAAAVSNVAFGQLTAVVPATATSGPITVTTTDGAASSPTNFFLPASISSFTPNNSAPGSKVTITGSNFTNASAVNFNGQPAANFYVTNNTLIGAIVPVGVSTGPISVTTPAGTTNSTGLFYGAPVITGFAPTHGLPGTNVTISGANFLGATAVRFNGLLAATNPISNNQIVAIVPASATTGPISVTAPAGTATTPTNFVLDYISDLGVTVADAPDPVTVGSNLVYTITITNGGPLNAPNTQLTNTLPGSVTLANSSTSQGSLAANGNTIVGSLGTVLVGSSATVTLTVVAPQTAGYITNVATVANDYSDPVANNNTLTTATRVASLPLLSIRLLPASQVQITWPPDLTNYTLQFRTALVTNSAWSNLATVPPLQTVVTDAASGAMKFYRLRQ